MSEAAPPQPAQAKTTQKRTPRARSRLKVYLNGQEYTATEWNHAGCRIDGIENKVDIGDRLILELIFCGLSSESRIKCEGQVVWKHNKHTGIQFGALPLYEVNLVTHQLREALKLVGKKKEDFPSIKQPTETVELENVETVSRFERFLSSVSEAFLNVAGIRAVALLVIGIGGLSIVAYVGNRGTVRSQGTIVSDVEVIPATVDGTLVRLAAKEGESVRKGEKLFVIRDEDNYKAELSRVSELRKEYDEAEKKYRASEGGDNPGSAAYKALLGQRAIQATVLKSYEELYRQGAVSQEAMLEKRKELVKIDGEINVAKANETLIKPYQDIYSEAESRFRIPSPLDPGAPDSDLVGLSGPIYKWYASPTAGTILHLPRLAGSTITKGSTLAVIQPLSALPKVRTFLPHDQADRIAPGSQARITIPSLDLQLKGSVVGIDKRGGLGLKISSGQIDNLFEKNASLEETPAEVLIRISEPNGSLATKPWIGSKASVVIEARSTRALPGVLQWLRNWGQ
jgi:multidrug efflux pump subunit AcrA (membrane-fusion protein)